MRFIKTTDEISRIQSTYSRCQFIGTKTLTVVFETPPEVIAALLPPPLEPTAEPLGIAWVREVGNSNCAGPFMSSGVAIRARYADVVGNYCISTSVSTPEAMTFGRDLFGEPAKLARIIFEQQDAYTWGSAERHDIRYLSLRGRLDEPGTPGREQTSLFHYKFLPRADGTGFDSPPVLVHVTGDFKVDVAKRGRGELVFRDSPHDPLVDVPVSQVIDATYTEGHGYVHGRVLGEVNPEAFLPYAFTKVDSYDVVAEGTVLHAQAARRTREGKGQWRVPV